MKQCEWSAVITNVGKKMQAVGVGRECFGDDFYFKSRKGTNSKQAASVLRSKDSLACSFRTVREQHCCFTVSSFIPVVVPNGVGTLVLIREGWHLLSLHTIRWVRRNTF